MTLFCVLGIYPEVRVKAQATVHGAQPAHRERVLNRHPAFGLPDIGLAQDAP
jgi:hypothetical protein